MLKSVGVLNDRISDFRISKSSFCSRDTTKSRRQIESIVSHRIRTPRAVIPADLAYHKDAGTSEVYLPFHSTNFGMHGGVNQALVVIGEAAGLVTPMVVLDHSVLYPCRYEHLE
jgi:hypothetical protein